jgi:dUTP pyrophosphatase
MSYTLKVFTNNSELNNYLYRFHVAYDGDAGIDIPFVQNIAIPSRRQTQGIGTLVDLGFHAEMVDSMNRSVSYTLEPRSSIYKTKIRMSNSRGIIDSGYRGSIKAPIDNVSFDPEEVVLIEKGKKYFQILAPNLQTIKVMLVDSIEALSSSERNVRGFGSSS